MIEPNELKKGIKEEQEHKDIVKSQLKIKRIALEHLAKDPKYYSHLKQMENKYK